jgi:hypothetical protein
VGNHVLLRTWLMVDIQPQSCCSRVLEVTRATAISSVIAFSVMDASHRDRTSGAEAMCGVGCGHTTGGTIGGKVHEVLVACPDPSTQRREDGG